MAQILFHKQALTSQQKAKLAKEGVIAIRTDDPTQFRLLDAEIPSFGNNEYTWALIDALARASEYSAYGAYRLVENLRKLAVRHAPQTPEAKV